MRSIASIVRSCRGCSTRLPLRLWVVFLGALSTQVAVALTSQSTSRTTTATRTKPSFTLGKAGNTHLFDRISKRIGWQRSRREQRQEHCEKEQKACNKTPSSSIFSSPPLSRRHHRPQQRKILSQQSSFLPFTFTTLQSVITKMGAALSTLSMPEMLVLGIYVPSALNKMFAPSIMRELWPTLPKRIWFPTGVFELTGTLLAILAPAPYTTLGFAMMYSFMGGVLSSLVYIPDEQGHTHLSGKGKLGWGGLGPLLPATGSTALLYALDNSSTTPLAPGLYFTMGFGIGAWIYRYNNNKAKKTKQT
eukprot:scaffold34646_cov173-Amphora_coffeaeformis.AAC.4